MDISTIYLDNNVLEKGDIVTFAGEYKKRTFWQWITRQKRELERFTITDTGNGSADIIPITFAEG